MVPAPDYAKRYSTIATSPYLNRASRSLFEPRVARFVTRLLGRQRPEAIPQLSRSVGMTVLEKRINGAPPRGHGSLRVEAA
jgi:hypothetical protein